MGTILIVDDDVEIRETLRDLLADEGYVIHEAADGEEALEVLTTTSTRPCLVLLDMMMPRMNGNEFLDAIAVKPSLASIPVVVISAYPASMITGSVQGLVPKPPALGAIIKYVERFCSPSYVA